MKLKCCRPNPPCANFCRLDGRLIAGQGKIRNPKTGAKYEVLKPLAFGGMSTTYLAYNYQNNCLAVLKEMKTELAKNPKAQELFQREARILQSLDHRGIPKLYDFFFTQEYYCLVMEMIQGKTLEQVGAITPRQAVEWVKEICQILDYLHQLNPRVIHRDIKPANLILRYNPRQIVLIDFGAVKEATAKPGTRISTPGFGSPEQKKGLALIQSDLYAVGTTLVYLLTRKCPNEDILSNLNSFEIPRVLIPIIKILTSREPGDRPVNALKVIDLLDASLEELNAH